MPQQCLSEMMHLDCLPWHIASVDGVGFVTQGFCSPLHEECVPILEKRGWKEACPDLVLHGSAAHFGA